MKKNKSYLLRLLVGVSLLLLLIFLSFWNIENYNRSKTELEQDLNDQMDLACSEYRDSMVQSIFHVIAKDSFPIRTRFPSGFDYDHDSLLHPESLIMKKRYDGRHFPGPFNDEEASISITIDASDSIHDERSIIVWQSEQSSNLRFNYATDTIVEVFDSLSVTDRIPATLDRLTSTLPSVYTTLDSLFTERLKSQNIIIAHRLSKDSIDLKSSETALLIPFDYQSFGFHETPVALFENYQSYIWKKISPSILMSLLLFSVVAISFFALLSTWIKQQRLANIKNEFVSNMTHELKTPISTIGVALEALENYGGMEDPKRRMEYLNISKHEVNRLKILVDKVLKMSTLNQSENILQTEQVNLKSLIEAILDSMQLHFEKYGVDLSYNHTDGQFIVEGDKVHLTNVLYNLIDNAIKYASGQPKINIELNESLDNVTIKVADQGVGIKKEYQGKIFDRFFRVPNDDRHNVKGYGLGLHYVKTIIQQHGGQIKLNSQDGKGSTFTIKLPRK